MKQHKEMHQHHLGPLLNESNATPIYWKVYDDDYNVRFALATTTTTKQLAHDPSA
jgi:hypothetical protein